LTPRPGIREHYRQSRRSHANSNPAHGRHPTEQKDRKYFRSVYFREPGGVPFEVAIDTPGFAVDEPIEALVRDLKLPNFFEPRRKEIGGMLPVLEKAAS
jgi:glyoxalase family protein